MYRQMLAVWKIVDERAKAFGSNVDCDDCRFNDGESCSFGLPEYGTFECRDCVNFQKGD